MAKLCDMCKFVPEQNCPLQRMGLISACPKKYQITQHYCTHLFS